jgi:hypothetical protein
MSLSTHNCRLAGSLPWQRTKEGALEEARLCGIEDRIQQISEARETLIALRRSAHTPPPATADAHKDHRPHPQRRRRPLPLLRQIQEPLRPDELMR